MSERQVVIAIDAMGGEDSPFKVLKGTEIFLKKEKNAKVIFFGDEASIYNIIKEKNLNIFNFEVVNTKDVITDEDNVNTILRSFTSRLISLAQCSILPSNIITLPGLGIILFTISSLL